jgi:small subunit ribosomal protein S8
VSRPSLRKYVKTEQIPPVQNGLGVNVLSTSRGVVTDREARQLRIGGEIICSVW